MKKVTENDLVALVRERIHQRFASPEQVLQTFKATIRSKLRTLHAPKVLTESELEKHSASVAKAVFQDLGRISSEAICYRMSPEALNKSRQGGFRAEEYTSYFDDFAKELVRELLKSKFKQAVKQSITARKQTAKYPNNYLV